jgi:phospholipid/cholesterol/gamma-HCH transport system substrate-binding protein
MKSEDRYRLARVGAFVGFTLVVLVMVLGLLGRSRSLFSEKAVLYTSFDNISGLVVGAPVRLAGLDIGIVQSIRFERDLQIKKVRVTLGVQDKYLERIRQDSVAHLSSKGLLGDMLINITVGSSNFPPLHNRDTLSSQESQGMAEVVESVQDGISEVRKLASGVDERMRVVLSDDVAHDIKRVVRASADVMEGIERGHGLLHHVIYDPRLAKDAAVMISETQRSAENLNHALKRVDGILAAVENGSGTLHGLVYRDDGGKLLAELQQASADFGAVAAEVRHGRGTLHSLIYEDSKSNLITELTTAARILRTVAEEIQQGKGTVGGLLKDPTVYQDLKLIVGNVRRNTLLKILIRAAIRSEGLKRESGGGP